MGRKLSVEAFDGLLAEWGAFRAFEVFLPTPYLSKSVYQQLMDFEISHVIVNSNSSKEDDSITAKSKDELLKELCAYSEPYLLEEVNALKAYTEGVYGKLQKMLHAKRFNHYLTEKSKAIKVLGDVQKVTLKLKEESVLPEHYLLPDLPIGDAFYSLWDGLFDTGGFRLHKHVPEALSFRVDNTGHESVANVQVNQDCGWFYSLVSVDHTYDDLGERPYQSSNVRLFRDKASAVAVVKRIADGLVEKSMEVKE
jgi:hypothetical protein